MVVKGVELVMSRRQIDAMIKADPILVTFRRKSKINTPDGGWVWGSPTPLPTPQEVRLIPFKRRMTEFLVNTELGDLPDLPYVLLGRYNLNIQKDDLFTYENQEFEVKTLDIGEPEVKVAAHIDYYGGGINGS